MVQSGSQPAVSPPAVANLRGVDVEDRVSAARCGAVGIAGRAPARVVTGFARFELRRCRKTRGAGSPGTQPSRRRCRRSRHRRRAHPPSCSECHRRKPKLLQSALQVALSPASSQASPAMMFRVPSPQSAKRAIDVTGRGLSTVVADLAHGEVREAVAACWGGAVAVAEERLPTVIAELSGRRVRRAVPADRHAAVRVTSRGLRRPASQTSPA